jgi:citrate lyase subunit beta/citryl-CoA lyase
VVEADHRRTRRGQAAGKGVLLVDGKLIENLHVANARRIVALAERIASMSGASA